MGIERKDHRARKSVKAKTKGGGGAVAGGIGGRNRGRATQAGPKTQKGQEITTFEGISVSKKNTKRGKRREEQKFICAVGLK